MLGGIIALGGFIYLITATMFGVDELAGVAERIALVGFGVGSTSPHPRAARHRRPAPRFGPLI